MKLDSKIYVAGHNGLVGSAIVRSLKEKGYSSIISRDKTSLDLRRQADVEDFFAEEKPEYVFVAAAKVGGIKANDTYRGDFIYENLIIELNIINAARLVGVKKLLFLGSSCIYPKLCPQPMKEEYLLSGYLEQTNEPYAIAKIAGLKLCESLDRQYGTNFISAMPTNLYGINDNFHAENSHVLPALLRRFHEAATNGASEVVVWGSGSPLREFLNVDDLADGLIFMMNKYDGAGFLNIGSGREISIQDLATLIADITGFRGRITFDSTKPDGTPRKLLDNSRLLALGWKPLIDLRSGIEQTYEWFKASIHNLKGV
jgi:GDP-L-fucose synthase